MKMFRYFYFLTDEEIQGPGEMFLCQLGNISLPAWKYFSASLEIFHCQHGKISLPEKKNFTASMYKFCCQHGKMLLMVINIHVKIWNKNAKFM